MFRSIRWNLLAWHGLILASVIAGFGAVLYLYLERSILQGIDSELMGQARSIGDILKTKPGRRLDLEPTEEYRRRVQALDTPTSYFFILSPRGRFFDRSVNGPQSLPSAPAMTLPDVAVATRASSPDPEPKGQDMPGDGVPKQGKGVKPKDRPGKGRPQVVRESSPDAAPARGPNVIPMVVEEVTVPIESGAWREVHLRSPQNALIIVGRHMGETRRRLANFMQMGIAAGLGVLALALAGDWLITWHAFRPIARMSKAAAGITEEDMSRRIDVSRAKSELGELARILNGTFDRLAAAFERQATFTADASHELRTPLSVVITHAELALRKDRTPAEYRQTLETCLAAARRMKDLAEGLLTLARADARRIGLRRERLDLAGLVEDVVGFLQPLAIARGLRVNVTAEDVEVDGDRDRLHEVVTNLVANAIRYNRDEGQIVLDVRRERDEAVLTVSDTGIGIPKEDRAQVFERFYRVDKARSRERGGVGLGLAITKLIIEAHGGSIQLASIEGAGTTVTVRFPSPGMSTGHLEREACPRPRRTGGG